MDLYEILNIWLIKSFYITERIRVIEYIFGRWTGATAMLSECHILNFKYNYYQTKSSKLRTMELLQYPFVKQRTQYMDAYKSLLSDIKTLRILGRTLVPGVHYDNTTIQGMFKHLHYFIHFNGRCLCVGELDDLESAVIGNTRRWKNSLCRKLWFVWNIR
jgi:hypothetical protein